MNPASRISRRSACFFMSRRITSWAFRRPFLIPESSNNMNEACPGGQAFRKSIGCDTESGVDDEGADLGILLAVVGDCVAGACGAEHHIAGADGVLHTVVVVEDLALHEVEQLAVGFVDMVADAAAGLEGDVGEETALVVELCGGCEVGDLNRAVSATHLFPVFFLTICCFSDHADDLLFWLKPL